MKGYALLIEDDEHLAAMLEQMIEEAGYAPISAVNGLEGLALAREEEPAIVVTDIIMPEMDGLATIMRLKERYPHMKIIAISGGGELPVDYLEIARKLGVCATLDKPVRREELLRILDGCMNDERFPGA